MCYRVLFYIHDRNLSSSLKFQKQQACATNRVIVYIEPLFLHHIMLNYPFSIFLYQSEQMIKILNIPFYEDSRIWQTKARLSTSALSSCSPWSLQWTRMATTSSCCVFPRIQTGNNLFIPLFRRPCLISCETLSVKLPLAPFEFK